MNYSDAMLYLMENVKLALRFVNSDKEILEIWKKTQALFEKIEESNLDSMHTTLLEKQNRMLVLKFVKDLRIPIETKISKKIETKVKKKNEFGFTIGKK